MFTFQGFKIRQFRFYTLEIKILIMNFGAVQVERIYICNFCGFLQLMNVLRIKDKVL